MRFYHVSTPEPTALQSINGLKALGVTAIETVMICIQVNTERSEID